jgi:hypothetical protein
MEYRGPILIVFGMSLIMSAVAINLVTGDRSALPKQIATLTEAACNEASILSPDTKMQCQDGRGNATTERVMEGGAVFVSAPRR